VDFILSSEKLWRKREFGFNVPLCIFERRRGNMKGKSKQGT